MKKKYIIKNLSKILLSKILEKSNNYFITKSFKKEIVFKNMTVCKFNVPLKFSKVNLHFLLKVFLIESTNEMQMYFNNNLCNYDYSCNEIKNIKILKNINPLFIKNGNLIFSHYNLYNFFLRFFKIFRFILKLNLSILLLKKLKILV